MIPTILVIDNYDSFTYNLVHYVEDLGVACDVRRNDALSVAHILALKPKGVLISPGPGRPRDAGVCIELIKQAPADLPILGVCLGHQAIGEAFGGEVIAAKAIMHGKLSEIRHRDQGLFKGLPSPMTATRYHSLAVRKETLPEALLVDAETTDGEIMALRHRTRPIFGVQFHPESIASEHGHALIGAFLDQAGVR
ncbi:MAG: aminodeoxychorismate/anthranilate synthase component II [Hydrogenophilaceae bacterium]|nr:aminodeoxychorismate/anthranilate synthase component II [Hydrogenophilaceae bacterium]